MCLKASGRQSFEDLRSEIRSMTRIFLIFFKHGQHICMGRKEGRKSGT
jgi:hypothetical protein